MASSSELRDRERVAELRDRLERALRAACPAATDPAALADAALAGLTRDGRPALADTDDAHLHRAAHAALVAALGGATRRCPSPERLFDAAQDDLALDPAVARHVEGCPACERAGRLALELAPPMAEVVPLFPEAPPDVEEPAPPARSPSGAPRALALAIAAMAAITALVTLAVLPTYLDPPPTLGARLHAEAPDRVRRGEPVVLAWSGGPEGCTWDVVVTDASFAPIARASALTEPRWTLPAEATRALRVGDAIVWRVIARGPDGAVVTSPTWTLRVAPPALGDEAP